MSPTSRPVGRRAVLAAAATGVTGCLGGLDAATGGSISRADEWASRVSVESGPAEPTADTDGRPSPQAWLCQGGGSGRAAFAPAAAAPKPASSALTRVFRYSFGENGPSVDELVVTADGVFAAAGVSDGVLVALGPDATRRWSLSGGLSMTPPAVGDAVYVPTGGGQVGDALSALAPPDGAERWRASLPGSADAPTVVGSTVYAQAGFGLVALDADTGASVVRFSYPDPSDRMWLAWDTAVDGGHAYTALDVEREGRFRGHVVSVAPADGSVRWAVRAEKRLTRMAVRDDRVYGVFGRETTGTELVALDAAAGGVRWRTERSSLRPDAGRISDLAVGSDAVYVAGHGWVGAVGLDGEPRWTAASPGSTAGIAVAGDRLFAAGQSVSDGSTGGHLTAFDVADGSERWRLGTGSLPPVSTRPSIVGGRVYVGSERGDVLGFGRDG